MTTQTMTVGGLNLLLRLGTRTWVAPQGRVFRIGRHPGNDLLLSDPRISRFHAQISWDGEQPILHDCGSANGTLVDGLAVRGSLPLRPGQILGLGPWDLVVDVNRAPALLDDEGGRFMLLNELGDELMGTYKGQAELHRLLLSLEDEQRTGTLELTLEDQSEGTITLCLGQVVGAAWKHLVGLAALERLLSNPSGRYLFSLGFELSDNSVDVSIRRYLREGFWAATKRHRREPAPPLPRRRAA